MKLIPFISKPTEPVSSSSSSSSSSSTSWPWPSCGNPKTLSFRAEKIMNSVFVASETRYINSDSSSATIVSSTELVEEEYSVEESIENVIRKVRSSSERLFFDHKGREATSCIIGDHQRQELQKSNKGSNINDCVTKSSSSDKVVLIEMDSRDPFEDFKKSMEEMVEANGFNLKDDWEEIHHLLSLYLKFNDTSNHGYIVGAFVDLMVSLESSSFSSFSSQSDSSFTSCDEEDHNNASSSATVITQSPISALSFSSGYSTTPCLLTLFEEEEEEEEAATSLDHRR